MVHRPVATTLRTPLVRGFFPQIHPLLGTGRPHTAPQRYPPMRMPPGATASLLVQPCGHLTPLPPVPPYTTTVLSMSVRDAEAKPLGAKGRTAHLAAPVVPRPGKPLPRLPPSCLARV
jgi:hypothetical protein